MKYEKVKEVAQKYSEDIRGFAEASRVTPPLVPARMPEYFSGKPRLNVPRDIELAHHLWMCEEILKGEMGLEKAMRWLGWLNFFVYAKGWYTLDEIKELSRPIGEEETEKS